MGIATLLIGAFFRQRIYSEFKRLDQKIFFTVATSGFFLASHFIFWIISLEHTTVAKSTFLVTTTPVWVTLIGYFYLKETASRRACYGILLALASSYFIFYGADHVTSSDEGSSMLGEAFAIIGAISIAAHLIIGRKLRSAIGFQTYVFLTYLASTIWVLIFILLFDRGSSFKLTTIAFTYVVSIAIVPQLIGHTLINLSVRTLSATTVSTIVLLEPVVASFLAWIFLQEALHPIDLIGFVGILLGTYITTQSLDNEKE